MQGKPADRPAPASPAARPPARPPARRYQDQPEHASFKQLLQAPQDEAHAIIVRRFPTPRFTDCDQNGGRAAGLIRRCATR